MYRFWFLCGVLAEGNLRSYVKSVSIVMEYAEKVVPV